MDLNSNQTEVTPNASEQNSSTDKPTRTSKKIKIRIPFVLLLLVLVSAASLLLFGKLSFKSNVEQNTSVPTTKRISNISPTITINIIGISWLPQPQQTANIGFF